MLPSWYIPRTRPNAERRIGKRLGQIGIAHFVALQAQVRQWHDRRVQADVVLLPGDQSCCIFVVL